MFAVFESPNIRRIIGFTRPSMAPERSIMNISIIASAKNVRYILIYFLSFFASRDG